MKVVYDIRVTRIDQNIYLPLSQFFIEYCKKITLKIKSIRVVNPTRYLFRSKMHGQPIPLTEPSKGHWFFLSLNIGNLVAIYFLYIGIFLIRTLNKFKGVHELIVEFSEPGRKSMYPCSSHQLFHEFLKKKIMTDQNQGACGMRVKSSWHGFFTSASMWKIQANPWAPIHQDDLNTKPRKSNHLHPLFS